MARLSNELLRIARRCATRPVKDPRGSDEILGYDEIGLPSASAEPAPGAPADVDAQPGSGNVDPGRSDIDGVTPNKRMEADV